MNDPNLKGKFLGFLLRNRKSEKDSLSTDSELKEATEETVSALKRKMVEGNSK